MDVLSSCVSFATNLKIRNGGANDLSNLYDIMIIVAIIMMKIFSRRVYISK